MPESDPVNLYAAAVAMVVGTVLGLGLIVGMVREVRRRNALLRNGPPVDHYDRDIQRYTRRVWLLVAEWQPRLEAEASARLGEMWAEVLAFVERFHEARAAGDESPDDVAKLVQAEKEIEEFITNSRAG